MGSMVMSTFAMFMPWNVQFTFILLLCLGLSYLESIRVPGKRTASCESKA